MKIFDLHQDLMLHMCTREQYAQSRQTDWELLEVSPVDLVVATAFPDPDRADPFSRAADALIDADITRYQAALTDRPGWCCVQHAADLERPERKLLLHIEGLNTMSDSAEGWEQLERWYARGIRSFGLHWNLSNALGGGTNDLSSPLTSLGAEVVRWVEERQAVLDVAHSNRETFFAIAKLSKRPLLVSHGNAAAVCPSVRNYTDEQLECIARSDGVIGVFFAATFTCSAEANLDRLIDHIDHIVATAGIRHIALGSDFGGIVSGTLPGLASVADYSTLLNRLAERGYTDAAIAAITQHNAARVLSAHL